MSDLGHLQERLRFAAAPNERFAITLTERFVPDGYSGFKGKEPLVYITRWLADPYHESGTVREVGKGATVQEAMAEFEAWLKANPDPTRT